MTKVNFTEPITLPAPPRIVMAGRARFGQCPTTGVAFDKPIDAEYVVLVTGAGDNSGALRRSVETFNVTRRDRTGFMVESANNSSTAKIDYIVVVP